MSDILVLEDNQAIADGLRLGLEGEGYSVALEGDGDAAIAAISREQPALIILDLMLPGQDGFGILRRLRDDGHTEPVLILSALGEEPDKLRGFRLGADDYVTKPFGFAELVARVEALLRRHRVWQRDGEVERALPARFDGIENRPATRSVWRDGAIVTLRPREFDLLWALVSRPLVIQSRRALLTKVWGYSPEVASRTVDIHMVELRRKLEQTPADPHHLVTVRKAGYMFCP